MSDDEPQVAEPVQDDTHPASRIDIDEADTEQPQPVAGPSAAGFGREQIIGVLLWLVVGGVGLVMASQAIGVERGGLVAVAQSLTPFAALTLIPVAAFAVASRWFTMAAVAGAALVGAAVLAAPLVFPADQPATQPGVPGVRIAAVNLLYDNERTAEVADALAATDADLIVFTEYTAEHQAALLAHPLAGDFPHREERDGLRAGGTAVWSRFPITPQPSPDMTNYDVDVAVDAPSGAFRLWAVHPPSPLNPAWQPDLDTVAERAATVESPLVIAGDFNASYWHPAFRDILDAGMTDAHIALRRGWSTSWPIDRWHPAFVRIDHALTNDGLVATAIDDFDVPGSDHRGFVVTVAPAAVSAD